ncbi:MAG: UvrD-helicase domain-containing protein [Acidobacteria bacterium]|nr:UvrD-helicase domain-containing protein [Acidobacteriota bacterium]
MRSRGLSGDGTGRGKPAEALAEAGRSSADKPLTDAESRRVIREELLTNFLVEAGAGSGKTQMLAERMAAGVAAGVYQVEQIAAVTFTRKAASELRGRFHLALEKARSAALQGCHPSRSAALVPATVVQGLSPAGDDSPTDPDAIRRLEHALGNLERFFAGTIHSFCARLLRERPVESGVSPGFTELDEVQDEEVRKRAWRDFITSSRSAGDPDMLALLDTGVKPKDLDSAFATICLNEDVEFPPGDGVCPDPKPAWKALQEFWTKLEKLLPEIIGEDTTCGIQKAARQFRGQMRVGRKRLDRASTVASFLETWKCDSKIIQNRWAKSASEKARYKELVETLHAEFRAATVDPFLAQWKQYVYRLAVTLLMRARDQAARERRRLNSLNYGDLLNLTANVLRENAQVRGALQQKYRHLFVDEFQDTDPVQAEIVFLLAADEHLSGNAASILAQAVQPTTKRTPDPGPRIPEVDWRQVSVRPGALFVVGDPKQSIYRFRRADIEIYNIVRERFSDASIGRVLPLTMNFRSVPALCEWANTVFKGPFPSEPTQHSPRFAPLDPHDDPTKVSSGGVFTLTHTCSDSRDVPKEDAAKIARYIKSEVDAGRRKYSDFLILTRKKRARIAPYASALEQLNIPIEVSGAGAFGESAEVAALTVLLRALADPQDALTLVAVLRGPLFGISDPELFAFKQSGGWFSIFVPPRIPHPASPVQAALAALNQYYRWTRMRPAGAALDRILEHTGYLALAATTPGGVEAGDLLHAVDRVRQVVEDGGSLADAADALEADSEASNEVESLPLEPGRTDVVRLMNLHKAKGLEADVVFLADPCGGMKPRVDVHIERSGLKAHGWFKVAIKFEKGGEKVLGEHADWAAHEAAELPYLGAEQSRLFYVAATRARQLLIVSRQMPQKGTAAWGLLNGFLDSATELAIPATVSVTSPKPANCSIRGQSEAQAARTRAQDAVTPPSWSITSVTAEAKHIAKMTGAAEPAESDDATQVVTQDTPSHRADAGMAWGTLIHGLLEHAMRHKNASREDLRRLAMWLTVEEPQLRAVLDEALETVERAARADFWSVAQSHIRSVETPFTMTDQGRLTNGVIDLLFDSEAGWQVVDYKTDRSMEDGRYVAQLEAYRTALRRVGCQVAGVSVVNVRTDQ